eukprot:5843132-Pyramimonas_sp.AAC.1
MLLGGLRREHCVHRGGRRRLTRGWRELRARFLLAAESCQQSIGLARYVCSESALFRTTRDSCLMGGFVRGRASGTARASWRPLRSARRAEAP